MIQDPDTAPVLVPAVDLLGHSTAQYPARGSASRCAGPMPVADNLSDQECRSARSTGRTFRRKLAPVFHLSARDGRRRFQLRSGCRHGRQAAGPHSRAAIASPAGPEPTIQMSKSNLVSGGAVRRSSMAINLPPNTSCAHVPPAVYALPSAAKCDCGAVDRDIRQSLSRPSRSYGPNHRNPGRDRRRFHPSG
jgi:hypothetical protein